MHYHTENCRASELEPGDAVIMKHEPIIVQWAFAPTEGSGWVALGLADGRTLELRHDAIMMRVPACELCGELADAEMAEFATGSGSVFAHAGCGLERGMGLA